MKPPATSITRADETIRNDVRISLLGVRIGNVYSEEGRRCTCKKESLVLSDATELDLVGKPLV